MLAKTIIQNLEDSELIRIFLDFVQTFHLQYQKINKEISYKCHQATWILATTKATGYGRTQSEAYKHALRNLLQILIEDPPYVEFFSTAINKSSTKNNHSHCLANSVNPFSNKSSKPHSHTRQNIKTETDISQDEGNKERYSMYTKNKQFEKDENPPLRQKSISSHHNYGHSSSNSKLSLSFSMNKNGLDDKEDNNIKYKERKEKEVYHTKINLNRNGQYPHPPLSKQQSAGTDIARCSLTTNGGKSKNKQEQIERAKQKMKKLEEQLMEVQRENQMLRQQLNPQNTIKQKSKNSNPPPSIPPSSSYTNALRLSTGSVKSSYQNNGPSQIKTQPAANNEDDYENYPPVGSTSGGDDKKSLQNTTANPKIFVPKLKLQILPNYHKKSQKSLNQSLLAVYNEKHGGNKKLI